MRLKFFDVCCYNNNTIHSLERRGWFVLLWANTLNCSMQMRAITKLLGEEMTAEVGFGGELTQTVVMVTMQSNLTVK